MNKIEAKTPNFIKFISKIEAREQTFVEHLLLKVTYAPGP